MNRNFINVHHREYSASNLSGQKKYSIIITLMKNAWTKITSVNSDEDQLSLTLVTIVLSFNMLV